MEMFAWTSHRNFRVDRIKSMSQALALVQDPRAAAQYVGDILTIAYGPLKGTAKHIARVANANERSAENWIQKKVCPNVPTFLLLAMQVPELNAAVTWLMQNGPGHPEAQRHMAEMERYLHVHPRGE